MTRADLHIHSTVSDGGDTLAELAEIAVRKGLGMIAVTDHDTVAHLTRLPRDPRVRVLGGVEISAIDPGTGVKAHVLAYALRDPAPVEALVAPIRERRHQNSLRQVELLRQHGLTVDTAQMAMADGRYLYKQHIMEYLVRTGQADAMFGRFYRSVFKGGGYCDFDIQYADVAEAVFAVHRAGGLAVLAHPGQQQNFYLLGSLPFDGVEYNHMANGPEDREAIMECVRDSAHPLFLTGGSDSHGRYNDVPVEMGDYLSMESGVRALC